MVRTEDKALAATIGSTARALRTARGATQEEVAEWVGLASQVYSRLERGQMLPSLSTLVRLARAFAVSPAAFFEWDGAAPMVVVEPGAVYRPSTRSTPDIAEPFSRLDASTQAVVMALVRHLARRTRRAPPVLPARR
jgi:transcriptional regulator with XRE-family HTH domain